MPKYEVVGVRFNMSKKEEVMIYNSLNSRNRAGHIKRLLKEIMLNIDLIKDIEGNIKINSYKYNEKNN